VLHLSGQLLSQAASLRALSGDVLRGQLLPQTAPLRGWPGKVLPAELLSQAASLRARLLSEIAVINKALPVGGRSSFANGARLG
jgi:hypothetical protein